MPRKLPSLPLPANVAPSTMETVEISIEKAKSWKLPPFQRALRTNDKVRDGVDQIKKTQIIPGVITLGRLDGSTYIIDGQHRREMFYLAELPTARVDIRTITFSSMAEMGLEFVRLNSALVKMKPDDVLRGLEETSKSLQRIREQCPFVGYDMIRRRPRSPILSMSAVLRTWLITVPEAPSGTGLSAVDCVSSMTEEQTTQLIAFLKLAHTAWGDDEEYKRLWGTLNLAICMWLYRRTVLSSYTAATTRLSKELFYKCLMSLSAASNYLDWLVGRNLGDRDRGPCYNRIRQIFRQRLAKEGLTRPGLPAPPWAPHQPGHGYKV